MFKNNSKVFKRAFWTFVTAMLVADNAWAEDDIPPFDGESSSVIEVVCDLWNWLAGLVV